jgi:hypothetical protein
MRRHYLDKSDWRDRVFMRIMFVISIPVGVILRLFFGEREGK